MNLSPSARGFQGGSFEFWWAFLEIELASLSAVGHSVNIWADLTQYPGPSPCSLCFSSSGLRWHVLLHPFSFSWNRFSQISPFFNLFFLLPIFWNEISRFVVGHRVWDCRTQGPASLECVKTFWFGQNSKSHCSAVESGAHEWGWLITECCCALSGLSQKPDLSSSYSSQCLTSRWNRYEIPILVSNIKL